MIELRWLKRRVENPAPPGIKYFSLETVLQYRTEKAAYSVTHDYVGDPDFSEWRDVPVVYEDAE